MRNISNTDRLDNDRISRPAQPGPVDTLIFSQAALSRLIGLINLGVSIINGLICLRFLLKLVAANPNNVFARLIYNITAPLLIMFNGLPARPHTRAW